VFGRILVAYDGSPHAEEALALALRLRDPAEGILTLACVELDRPWHRRHRPAADVPEEIAFMLSEACAAQVPPGIRVTQRAPVAASAARGLTELAETEGADLVVVGCSPRRGPGRVSIGRTAGRLLQGAPCAVAIAPAGLRETERFRHVAIAYDGTPEARAALDAGYRIAAGHGSAVTILYALDDRPPAGPNAGAAAPPGDDALRVHAHQLLDEAAGEAPAGVNPRTLLLRGVPGGVIPAACDGIVDLLVAGSRGYGPMQRALLGSVSEALADGATQPVLVLPRLPERVSPRPPTSATADR
jgi:nucleotide-binding universal stress UspA family protein